MFWRLTLSGVNGIRMFPPTCAFRRSVPPDRPRPPAACGPPTPPADGRVLHPLAAPAGGARLRLPDGAAAARRGAGGDGGSGGGGGGAAGTPAGGAAVAVGGRRESGGRSGERGRFAASVIQRAKRRDRPRARQPGVDAKGSWRWARRPTAAGGGKCWKRTDSLSAPSAASCWRGGHRGLVNCGTVPWRTVVLTHPGHRRPRAPGRAPPRAAASLALSPSPLPPPLPLPPPPSGRSFAPSLPPSRSCRYDCLRACHRWLAASPQRPASRRPAYPPPDGVP